MNNTILPGIVYPAGNGYINTLKPTISGTGAPGAVINGKIDTTPFTASVSEDGTWSVNCDIQLTDKTEHTVVLSQMDQNGMAGPQVTARFRTDTSLLTPQTVAFPYNNQVISTNAPVFSGSGKPGALIEADVCGRNYTTTVGSDGAWHIACENLPEGVVKTCVRQRDMGNTCPDIQLSFTVDTKAPSEPILDAPSDGGYTKETRPVIRGRGEPDAVIDAMVDDKRYAAKVSPQGTWSIEVGETLVEDVHIISARQKDQAGNQSPERITLFTVKSKQPPLPVLDSPKPGEFTRDASPTLCGRGELDCVIEAHIGERMFSTRVDGTGRWSLKIPMLLPEGPNTIKLYQIDGAGNVSRNVDLSLVVDSKAPPPPSVVYPEKDGYIINSDFCVKGTGEPEATIECTLGAVPYKTRVQSDGSWQIDIKDNESIRYAMEYSLSVRQIDLAGNQSPCTRVNFRLDQDRLTEPEITYPRIGSSISTVTPVLTGTGKAGAAVRVNIGNETQTTTVKSDGTWSLTPAKPLCPGEVIANICQADAGNTSAVKTVRFTVDLAVPQPPVIISPIDNQIVGGPLIISGSGESGATVTVRFDEKTYTTDVRNSNWVIPVPDTVENGIHSILACQTDEAGNRSRCSAVTFVFYSEKQSAAVGVNGTATYQMMYNPPGPEWAQETIVTLKSDAPLSVKNVCGTIFSAVVRKNGIYNIDYLDQNGCAGSVTAAVTWVDTTPPAIILQSSGNQFSTEKTVQYFKPCGAAVETALLNGMPFDSGRVVTEEGIYQVEIRDQAGNVAREQFFIDRTPPVITGAENGRVYKQDVTLRFYDSLSGVQSAILNGKNILSCAAITADGDYSLKVTDYGGNFSELKFHIQK